MVRASLLLAGLLVGGAGLAVVSTPPATSGDRGAAPQAANPLQQAQAAAEERVRASRPGGETRFRGMQAYRQAMPGTVAVCGQTNLSDGPSFVPFVAVVSPGQEGTPGVDLHVGRTGTEAARVYAELVARCFEGGGPVPRPGGGLPIPQPVPPLPVGLTDAGGWTTPPSPREPLAAAQPGPAASAAPAPFTASSGSLVVRSPANLRSAPGSGSAVLRVARAGATFKVFGQAPGGWYQVGNDAPEGWIHGSLASVQ